MGRAVGFLLRIVAGTLLLGAVGFAADVVGGTEGWWFWGLCAGAIAGALAGYLGQADSARQ